MTEEYKNEQLYVEKFLSVWIGKIDAGDIVQIEEELEYKLDVQVIISLSDTEFLVRLFKAGGIKRYVISRNNT